MKFGQRRNRIFKARIIGVFCKCRFAGHPRRELPVELLVVDVPRTIDRLQRGGDNRAPVVASMHQDQINPVQLLGRRMRQRPAAEAETLTSHFTVSRLNTRRLNTRRLDFPDLSAAKTTSATKILGFLDCGQVVVLQY